MANDTAISLHFRISADDLTVVRDAQTGKSYPAGDLDTKILIYEDRVMGWFLRVADELRSKDRNSGYVVLQIACSQVEGLEQYHNGATSRGRSRPTFVAGMRRIFELDTSLDGVLGRFYDAVRNGLFHDGFTKSSVAISWGWDQAVSVDHAGTIQVNPSSFLDHVVAAVSKFAAALKDPVNVDLRANFERQWDRSHPSHA
jgi:hypothetical protein